MEELLVREGNNHTCRSSTLIVSPSKNQTEQSVHYRCMGFQQQFHLVIKYKKGMSNKVAYILSRPPIVASIILKNASLSHDSYVEQYTIDEDFKEVYDKLTHGAQVENYCLQGKLLYHLGNLCIPTSERFHVIREAHTSLVSENFGVGKTMTHLQLASDESNCN